jgi:hypothetical protein
MALQSANMVRGGIAAPHSRPFQLDEKGLLHRGKLRQPLTHGFF